VPTVICAAVVAERIAASIAPIGAALRTSRAAASSARISTSRTTRSPPTPVTPTSARSSSSRSAASRWWRSTRRYRAAGGQAAHIVSIQGKAVRCAHHRAIEIARALAPSSAASTRLVSGSALVLSVKCAARTTPRGSRPIGGSAASPTCSSTWRRRRAREIAEIMGAEHLLAARASAPATAAHLLRVVSRVEAEAMALGLASAAPSRRRATFAAG